MSANALSLSPDRMYLELIASHYLPANAPVGSHRLKRKRVRSDVARVSQLQSILKVCGRRKVHVDGHELVSYTAGAAHKPRVLLLHGFSANKENWFANCATARGQLPS